MYRRLSRTSQSKLCLHVQYSVMLAWFVVPGLLVCAQNATPPSDTQSIPQADSPLTQESIQALKAVSVEAKDIDEPTRTRLQILYDQTLAELNLAKEAQDQQLSFDQNRETIPAKLETLKNTPPEAQSDLPELPSSEASQDQIQQALSQANLAVEQARTSGQELEQEPKRQAHRRTLIPEQIGTLKQATLTLDEQIKAAPLATPADKASAFLLRAKRQTQTSRVDALNAELLYYDASRELLSLQRDEATRVLDGWQKQVSVLQDRLNQHRKAEAEKTRTETLQATQKAELFPPMVQDVAQTNRELAKAQKDLTDALQKAETQEKLIKEKLQILLKDIESVKERLSKAHGVTHITRNLLRNEQAKLNKFYNAQANRRSIKDRLRLITDTEYNIYNYDQEWTKLRNIQANIDKLLSTAKNEVTESQHSVIQAKLEELYQSQRTIIDSLSKLSLSYSGALADLDVTERELVTQIGDYQHFIDEHILWVRAGSISDFLKPGPLWEAMQWLTLPSHWHTVGLALWTDFQAQPEFYAMAAIGLALITLVRQRVVKHIKTLTEKTRHAYTDRFFHTLVVILLTTLMSLGWSATLWFVGWRLASSTVDSEFVNVMAGALATISFQAFVLIFFYWLLLPNGLALQLGLTDKARAFLRRHLVWFTLVSLPLALTGCLLQEQQTNQAWVGGLGRLLLILNLGAFTLLVHVVLHPKGPVISPHLEKHDGDWFERLHPLWRGLGIMIPAGITILALFGYAFAARHLYQKLMALALLAVGCQLLYALLVRWLELTKKKSLFRLQLKRRKITLQETHADTPTPENSEAPEEDIQSISDQTRRLIRAVSILVFLSGVWWIFQSVLPAMNLVQDFTLWETTSNMHITIGRVSSALLIAIMTVIVTRNVPGFLEITLLQNLPLDRGVRFAVTTLCRYCLAIMGIILAFSRIGIGWSKVQWLVAAMTVGLGFGLQEIFANFVSGLIILFEQPIRVDDVVTVDDVTGVVSKIKIRATTIRKWDRRELIVPNKEFITSRLVNWTLSDNIMRMAFPVGIAYGSDTAKAEELLYEIAHADEEILADPASVVVFKNFGDSCLDFELRVYFNGIETYLPLWHRTNMAIDQAFREANIEIAFPQHDLHIRSSDIPLPSQG